MEVFVCKFLPNLSFSIFFIEGTVEPLTQILLNEEKDNSPQLVQLDTAIGQLTTSNQWYV